MSDELSIFSDYGIFSDKNSKSKSFGKITIKEEGNTNLLLMNNFIKNDTDEDNPSYKLRDSTIFGHINDNQNSIIIKTENTYKAIFSNRQNFYASVCLFFSTNIKRYKLYYDKSNITSMELDISDCDFWFLRELPNETWNREWITDLGTIQINEERRIQSNKIILKIIFSKKSNVRQCIAFHIHIIRFIATFIYKYPNLTFPKIIFSNGEIATLYHHTQTPLKKNTSMKELYSPLRYNLIGESLGHYISNYIAKYDIYQQSYYLYTLDTFQKMNIEHQFATLAWGFEVLMDKHYNGFEQKTSIEEEELINSCLIFLQKEQMINRRKRDKWAKKLNERSSPTLDRKTSQTILNLFSDILDNDAVEKFSISYRNMRNDISHRGGIDENGNKPNYINMQVYTECIRFFYFSLLMSVIDIPIETIKNLFNPYYYLYKGCDLQIRGLQKEKMLKIL